MATVEEATAALGRVVLPSSSKSSASRSKGSVNTKSRPRSTTTAEPSPYRVYIRNPMSWSARKKALEQKPTLRYSVRCRIGPLPHENKITSAVIPGINTEILAAYASNVEELLNPFGTLQVPSCIYDDPDTWPHALHLQNGQPMTTIISVICEAFAAPYDKVFIAVSGKLNILCALLASCRILGLSSVCRQLEVLIKYTLQNRPLTMKEVKAVYSHHANYPNPYPEILEMTPGFGDNEIMLVFASNLKEKTVPAFKDEDAKVEWAAWLSDRDDMRKLLYEPDLGTWVTMVERRSDREWSKLRLHQWVEEMGDRFYSGSV